METPLSPLEFLRRSRRLYPDREAVIDEDLRLTYSRQGRTQQPKSYVHSFANAWHTSKSLSRSRL
jgi:hypothetical protein